MPPKRTLDTFFQPRIPKRAKLSDQPEDTPETTTTSQPPTTHKTYPFPIPHFPDTIQETLTSSTPASEGKPVTHLRDLDLLYFQPFIPASAEREIFTFLRSNLFFYRVKYKIKRGPLETDINTPRFTTVFGLDETSKFGPAGEILDAKSGARVAADKYKKCVCEPRPIPGCLEQLKLLTEVFTGHAYNFCLVNYYASGNDSISYHSDDERFLGAEPAIASFSLGARRDFLLRRKPLGQGEVLSEEDAKVLKYPLASGDMILMQGRTQANWLHSIPKRKGGEADRGRINITFRKAIVPGGTANYYQYNVGVGEVYKWSASSKQMEPWVDSDKPQA